MTFLNFRSRTWVLRPPAVRPHRPSLGKTRVRSAAGRVHAVSLTAAVQQESAPAATTGPARGLWARPPRRRSDRPSSPGDAASAPPRPSSGCPIVSGEAAGALFRDLGGSWARRGEQSCTDARRSTSPSFLTMEAQRAPSKFHSERQGDFPWRSSLSDKTLPATQSYS